MRPPIDLPVGWSCRLRRRDFIALLAAPALAPRLARAQGKRPTIGVLALNGSETDPGLVAEFLRGLADLSYVDGKTATIAVRYATGEQKSLPALAAEIARLKPDVIMADTASPIKAARSAAPGVPIVGAVMGFPIEQGLIASFARPGGNTTGMASNVEGMNGKLIELGKELVPQSTRMGLLVDPGGSAAALMQRSFEAAAKESGLDFHSAEAHVVGELDAAVGRLADAGSAFMCIEPISMLNLELARIAQIALARRLPTISNRPDPPDTGILLAYGVDYIENYRRAAIFVDKILKGAKPGELPVEFPTKVQLIVNLKTAKALGITVPATLLVRADQVIE
ncbi:MAG TPA: ABC transporter substrate-binding protein [Stellaceae bacterium]|jgi:putative tryptophan/tyrosine transport system substrate-binding protein|nr:ABC transporter substrate-binding protein [Stellaceae bacterium]